MKKILSIIFLVCASQTIAAKPAKPVLLETPVTYAPNAGVMAQVKEECKVENMLEENIGNMLKKYSGTETGTLHAGENPADVTVMRVQITNVMGVGGGAWSGPKSVSVNVELLENGIVTHQTKVSRWNVGGMWGGFRGTCSIINRSTLEIAKVLNRWVKNPSYKIKEQAPPKDTASSPEEAQQPEDDQKADEKPDGV